MFSYLFDHGILLWEIESFFSYLIPVFDSYSFVRYESKFCLFLFVGYESKILFVSPSMLLDMNPNSVYLSFFYVVRYKSKFYMSLFVGYESKMLFVFVFLDMNPNSICLYLLDMNTNSVSFVS